MARHSRNHIVTKGHLALFAKDGVLACRSRDGSVRRLSPGDVAVRKNFYVTRDAAGNRDTSFEEAMAVHESEAVPVLRDISHRWPLDERDSAVLAEYVGLQVVRSPAFRRTADARRADVLDRFRAEREALLSPERWDAFESETLSDQARLQMTGQLISRAATLLGSMHWSLVRFSSADVVIGDHPLVAVPLGTGPAGIGRTGSPATQAGGLTDLMEVRLPVDPRHVLLLS